QELTRVELDQRHGRQAGGGGPGVLQAGGRKDGHDHVVSAEGALLGQALDRGQARQRRRLGVDALVLGQASLQADEVHGPYVHGPPARAAKDRQRLLGADGYVDGEGRGVRCGRFGVAGRGGAAVLQLIGGGGGGGAGSTGSTGSTGSADSADSAGCAPLALVSGPGRRLAVQ